MCKRENGRVKQKGFLGVPYLTLREAGHFAHTLTREDDVGERLFAFLFEVFFLVVEHGVCPFPFNVCMFL